LPRLRSPKFDIREIFGASRFSTFSTVSAQSGQSPKRLRLLSADAAIKDPDGNQIVFAQGKGEKHAVVS
jgi:hypothetical protein